MTWLIIVVALFAAFGPLLWMMPSRADRRLAKMRSRARTPRHSRGDHPTRRSGGGAASAGHFRWREARSQGDVRGVPARDASTRARRAAMEDSAQIRRERRSDRRLDLGDSPAGDAAYWQEVGEVLRALPPDALACATDASEVTCWWRERTTAEDAEASVDRLHAVLQNLAEIQLLADAAATAAAAAIDASDDTSDDASTRQ